MRRADITSMDASGTAFALQPEPSRTREDARIAAEEAIASLQAAIDAMAARPEIVPARCRGSDDGMFSLTLADDMRLILSRPGNSFRRLRLVVERNGSTAVSCQIDSRLEKGTRAHFQSALVLFLLAAKGAMDPAPGDEALDDLKAVVARMDDDPSWEHVLRAPLPWRAGKAGTRPSGAVDAPRAVEAPEMPFAAAITCVHDFRGVSISVDALTVRSDPDMDAMERLRMLRRSARRAETPSMRLIAA